MKVSGIKDWSKLDAELVKLVSAWDSIPNRNRFYRWARLIRGSVKSDATAPDDYQAVEDILKNIVPRFPSLTLLEDWTALREADGQVRELISGLDDLTRLRLAGIYWRWGQVADNIAWKRRYVQRDKDRVENQQSQVVFNLRPEHKPTIDGFRRRFWAGKIVSDDHVVEWYLRAAFLIPDQIHDATRRMLKYSNAEGLNQDDAIRAMSLSAVAKVSLEIETPGTLPTLQPAEADLTEANKLCDPALNEFSLDLDAAGRLHLAERLELWTKQLRASAAMLQSAKRAAS